MELHDCLARVNDEKSFLQFVHALIEDRKVDAKTDIASCGRGGAGWENHSIETFLDAACAWAAATNMGQTQGMGEANPWKRFATFLYCGKIYE